MKPLLANSNGTDLEFLALACGSYVPTQDTLSRWETCELQTALAKGRVRRVERLGLEKGIAVLLALDSRLWTLVRFASAKTAHLSEPKSVERSSAEFSRAVFGSAFTDRLDPERRALSSNI